MWRVLIVEGTRGEEIDRICALCEEAEKEQMAGNQIRRTGRTAFMCDLTEVRSLDLSSDTDERSPKSILG